MSKIGEPCNSCLSLRRHSGEEIKKRMMMMIQVVATMIAPTIVTESRNKIMRLQAVVAMTIILPPTNLTRVQRVKNLTTASKKLLTKKQRSDVDIKIVNRHSVF